MTIPDTLFVTDQQRWHAVQNRDTAADAAFLYGVQTTGIYCRPTCSSRLPIRENVQYFSGTTDAETAGFRACKRCKPKATSPRQSKVEIMIRACQLIEEAETPPTLETLATTLGLSPSHFHRQFKTVVGVTPKEFAAALRARRVKEGLADGASVTQSLYDAGFNASSRFYEEAPQRLGMNPKIYKNGATGQTIAYTVAESSLGWITVATTHQGVCAIEFGDTPEALVETLYTRFPKATLKQDEPAFTVWVSEVLAYIETPHEGLDLPLDIQGTAFQQRVWKALQHIPTGTTWSYARVAEQIGKPKAVRAVATACASNKIALAIPCHRVVRSDGSLGGYRWGTDRKRDLLQREAQK